MTSVTMGHLCHCPGIPELVISSSIRHDAQGSAARSAQAWKVRGIVKSLRGPAPRFERDVYVNDGEVSHKFPSRRRTTGSEVDRHDRALISLSQQTRGKADGGFKEVQPSQGLPDLVEAPGFMEDRNVGGLSTAFRATFAGATNSLCLALKDMNRMHSQTSGARPGITPSKPLRWEPDMPVQRASLTSPGV